MKRYIILSQKEWNDSLIDTLKKDFPNDLFVRISKKEDLSLQNIEHIKPDIIFVPHWSYIIPKEIYENYICIVFHMTDLPFGRGGSPLQNLIINGFNETKISALRVDKGIDTGDIYLKKSLNLNGSAEEIYLRANDIICSMIKEIIILKPKSIPQEGEAVYFKRRRPSESDISSLSDLDDIYNHIRMLDADGYPHAFINVNDIEYSFTRVCKKSDGSLIADVRIKKKN